MLSGVAAGQGAEDDIEVSRSDSKVASTRLTSRCLRGSSARPVGGLKPRETIVMVGLDDA